MFFWGAVFRSNLGVSSEVPRGLPIEALASEQVGIFWLVLGGGILNLRRDPELKGFVPPLQAKDLHRNPSKRPTIIRPPKTSESRLV